MKVVLLESIKEADIFIKYCEDSMLLPGEFHILSIWPDVRTYLRKKNIHSRNTLSYFNNESHANILLKTEEWLTEIEKTLNIEDGIGIKNSYNTIFKFWVRSYMNHFMWNIELLRGICNIHDVSCLMACVFSEPKKAAIRPGINNNDSYVGDITREFARVNGVEFCDIGKKPFSQRKEKSGISIISALKKYVYSIAAYVSGQYFRVKYSKLSKYPTIMVTTLSYNMSRLVDSIRKKYPDIKWIYFQPDSGDFKSILSHFKGDRKVDGIVCLESYMRFIPDDEGAKSRISKSLDETKNSIYCVWNNIISYMDVSFVDIFGDKIERDLFEYIRLMAKKTWAMKCFLEKYPPRFIISPYAIDITNLLGEISTYLGIPSLSITHGTFVPPRNRLDEIEEYRLGTTLILTQYGYTAVQTPWAERYIEHFRDKCAPMPLKTGNLILGKIDNSKRGRLRKELFNIDNENMKIIVYATTLKKRASLRFHTHETIDEHIEGISDLIEAVKNINNAFLVIKLHPALAVKVEELSMLLKNIDHERVCVLGKAPFGDILTCADLMVSYSSTVIEDALLNDIPVMLYDRWDRYKHITSRTTGSGEDKVSPVYYVNDKSKLVDSLGWIINNHDHDKITDDEKFHHVYKDDGNEEFMKFVGEKLYNDKVI